jgi:cell wall assembly regulator SMI1
MQTITQNFERLDECLKTNWKEGYDDLNPPITDDEIIDVNHVLGFEISKELEEFLKCHNGQDELEIMFEDMEFLSSHKMIEFWKM